MAQKPYDMMKEAVRCPVHGIPDCSPLLNACSLPSHLRGALNVGRLMGVIEARDEINRMLATFPQQGRHTRARWAVQWLQQIIERLEGTHEV